MPPCGRPRPWQRYQDVDILCEPPSPAAARRQRIQVLRAKRIEQSKILFSCLLPRASYLYSLDHPIRSRQHVGRNRETDLLGRLQVDDELKLLRPLDGQVG